VKRQEEQHGQEVHGPQTNIDGDVKGPVLSGVFNAPVTVTQPDHLGGMVPLLRPQRVVHLVDRKKEIEQVLSWLAPGVNVTICGPGGIGKTAIASAVTWQLAPESDAPEGFPHGILFHDFNVDREVAVALRQICYSYDEEPEPNPFQAAFRVLANKRALVVLDGAENADDLERILQVAGSCGVLVTSQSRQDARQFRLDIKPLTSDYAGALVQVWAGEGRVENHVAERISDLVGGLPLAARIAGRYISCSGESASDYLAWLQASPLEALDRGNRKLESVRYVLRRSIEQLSRPSRQALAGISGLPNSTIQAEVMAKGLDTSESTVKRILGELVRHSLLITKESAYGVAHPLIKTYARRSLKQPQGFGQRISKLIVSYSNGRGQSYYLHSKHIALQSGKSQLVYYFAREMREGLCYEFPQGYEVVETTRTGMPVLRRLDS
jgi:hypothetical protein